jgi:hypothetical protein
MLSSEFTISSEFNCKFNCELEFATKFAFNYANTNFFCLSQFLSHIFSAVNVGPGAEVHLLVKNDEGAGPTHGGEASFGSSHFRSNGLL